MTLVPLILAAAAVLAGDQSPVSNGVALAGANVGVEILRPAIVRQNGGWQDGGGDRPRPQVSRRDGAVLIEFQ